MTEKQAFIDAQQQMIDRYDVEVQSKFIDISVINGRAHVLVSGEGPAVVMINGIGTPAAMWAPLMAELNGFQLFAVDLPGYGLTDTTGDFAENLKDNAIRFIREVLDGLNLESPFFIANSLGSLFTSWVALDLPDRVAAIVHIGCPALVLSTSAPVPMRLLSVRPLGRLMTRIQPPSEKQVEQLSRMVNEYPLVPELSDLLVATERLPDFRETFLSSLHSLLHLRGSRPEVRLTAEQLRQIRQPTLLFWGQGDPFGSPEVGEHMVEAMPDARMHVTDGGHAPWLTQAEKIAPSVIQFFRKQVA